MKLKNPFHPKTRELFRDIWECWICETNGQENGGLELHHITGRDSNSALNGSILCKKCHAGMIHTNQEEADLTLKTIKVLYHIRYIMVEKDLDHLTNHPWLVTKELKHWTSLPTKAGHE